MAVITFGCLVILAGVTCWKRASCPSELYDCLYMTPGSGGDCKHIMILATLRLALFFILQCLRMIVFSGSNSH